ncbi:HNH endonuclease signature motif containing protein [Amycolatopsis sp. H20-H5]|uniref:HNH endonuclease signature motif containing protein n=1 Tax=Amycolatopsis sp. H20-H5 TaxID=3046309 RepID=UPI002DBEE46D|nr:DUF222 domain-containing protein [Amycolatopsis sp. H20-H5]MEC3979501.1 DUF222 domain-containing protein [Amycolatopsis sp. H20-H5]
MTSANVYVEPPQDLWRSGPRELAAIVHQLVEASRVVDASIGRVLAEIDRQGARELFGYNSTARFLVDAERMTHREAKKLLDRATALNPGRRLDGSDSPPLAPLTGAAARDGVLGSGHVDAIVDVMKKIPTDVLDDERRQAEEILVDLARKAPCNDVHNAGVTILDRMDPDGPEPDHRDPIYPLRTLRFQQKHNGRLAIHIEVDAVLAAQTRAVLDPLAERRTTDEGEPDVRSMSERYGDAYGEIIGLVITSPELPIQNGDHAHIMVTIPLDVLRSGLGTACLDLTETISATEARIIACDCGIIPAVLGTASEPLDLGRMKRFVTQGQRRALQLRDRGCAFPGCKRKPKHTQAHHILEWVLNGLTNLDNLVLLCGHHHRLIHCSAWEVRIATDGLPEFIPPDYLDPLRKPRRNTLHPPLAFAG